MKIIPRLFQAAKQTAIGLLCARSLVRAWRLHERGWTLGAALAYRYQSESAVPFMLLALQLDRPDWVELLLGDSATRVAVANQIALRLKTAPLQFADPLEAAEALVPHLSAPAQEALVDFVVKLAPARGRSHYLRGVWLQGRSDQSQAAAAFKTAFLSPERDVRGLAGWLDCSDRPEELSNIRLACASLSDDENAAFVLLRLEARQGGVTAAALIRLGKTQIIGTRPLVEQFSERLGLVKTLLEMHPTLAGFLGGLREQTAKDIQLARAGNPNAVALIGMANMGRLGADYLEPFTRLNPDYPTVFLVLASARVPELVGFPAPLFYVDEILLAQDHGFRLGIFDGANTMAVLLPDQMKLASVVHGAFTLPAAETYFWSDATSYFDYVLLGGPAPLRDVREGLLRFARTRLGRTNRRPNAQADGSVTPARSRRSSVQLIDAGQARLDAQLNPNNTRPEVPTITFAPTAPDNLPKGMSVFARAEEVVGYLLDRFPTYQIVFRPYPHALTSPIAARVQARFQSHPRFSLDSGGRSTAEVYRSTTIFVTDASTGGFSFQAATLRPAVFFLPKPGFFNHRFRRFLQECRRFSNVASNEKQIALAIRKYELDPAAFEQRAIQFRREQVFHLGRSEARLGEWLVQVMEGLPVQGETVVLTKGRSPRPGHPDQSHSLPAPTVDRAWC